jgi:hypothetical protein
MSIKLVLVVLGIVCFLLDAFHVTTPHVSWFPLGWAFLAAAVLLPL